MIIMMKLSVVLHNEEFHSLCAPLCGMITMM